MKINKKQRNILNKLIEKEKRTKLLKVIDTLKRLGKPSQLDKLYPDSKLAPKSYLDFVWLCGMRLTEWDEYLEATKSERN